MSLLSLGEDLEWGEAVRPPTTATVISLKERLKDIRPAETVHDSKVNSALAWILKKPTLAQSQQCAIQYLYDHRPNWVRGEDLIAESGCGSEGTRRFRELRGELPLENKPPAGKSGMWLYRWSEE